MPLTARKLLPPADAAAALGVCLSTLRRWRREGCPVYQIGISLAGKGSRPRYDAAAVKKWLLMRRETINGIARHENA